MGAASDTAARSLAHWSEAGRAEMEAFYALAREDYRLLALERDWPALLRDVWSRAAREERALAVLDVACGSGKFPEALLVHGKLEGLGLRLDVSLLDPSAFSVAEAAGVLRAPLREVDRLVVTLEDLDPALGPFDVVWATHALYALAPEHLDRAARRFVAALAPGHGLGVVAQGTRDGHYLRFYRAFLDGLRGGQGTPYLAAEDVVGALRTAGADVAERRLRYVHEVAIDDRATLEGYLQRCAFDDTVGLDELLAAPVVGPYLDGCRDDDAGVFRFHHEVDLAFVGEDAKEAAR